ncbi:MAG: ABC transporter permease [Methylobacteriaceae bacterium]|nr:ABC transporter permease [Methylobacteriaceae bacterium]
MSYVLRRLAHSLFVLWAVVTILFLMFRLMPGNPLAAYINEQLNEEDQRQIMAQFGLDRPLYQQYAIYLWNLLQGNLGMSFFRREPVWDVIVSALPNTLILTTTGLLVAYLFGVLAGAWLATKRGTLAEGVIVPAALATRAAPEFWIGMILLTLFAFTLGWFPSGGANSAGAAYASEWDRIFSIDFARHLFLPALTLALYLQGLPLLLMRSTMLEILHDEFITMARIKGLSPWRITLRHAARNALLPVVTAFALGLGATLGGNVVVETVFSWPGLGRLLVGAVAQSDYPLAQGAFFLISLVLISLNLLVDLIYGWLDPRVSHD